MPIFAVSKDEVALRKLKLTWGVTGIKENRNDDSSVENASRFLLDRGLVEEDDEIVWLTETSSYSRLVGRALVVARANTKSEPKSNSST